MKPTPAVAVRLRQATALLFMTSASACTGAGNAHLTGIEVAASKPAAQAASSTADRYTTQEGLKGLTIRGFNYTDLYISAFDVNGVGGGNLFVSQQHRGGGKGTCCARIPAGVTLPITIKVTWTRDGPNTPLCEQNVKVQGPIPTKPYSLDIHFYQDGTIQAAIGEFGLATRVYLDRFSPVQRKASDNLNNDAQFSRCSQ